MRNINILWAQAKERLIALIDSGARPEEITRAARAEFDLLAGECGGVLHRL